MRIAHPRVSLALAAALLFPSGARADWMTLRFGLDGPDALQKLPAFSRIAPDQAPLAGRSLYGSLDQTASENLQARFEGRYFIAKANFIFSSGKFYAVELTPRNIEANDVLALLIYEYGTPISVIGLSPQKLDYAWRDEKSGNFVLYRIGSTDEPRVIYRPLATAHSTGF